jgi:hypothetical protein
MKLCVFSKCLDNGKKFRLAQGLNKFLINLLILFFFQQLPKKDNVWFENKKRKLHLLFSHNEKYSALSSQKIINVFEINKTLELNSNSTYIKFINVNYGEKKFLKTDFFKKKSFFKNLRFLYFEKKKGSPFIYDTVSIINSNITKNLFGIICPNSINYDKAFKLCNFKKKTTGHFGKKKIFLEAQEKKKSIKNFYNFDLPEYCQTKGCFDSTGRRTNSFVMIVDQALYVVKKFIGLLLKINLDFGLFFKHVFHLLFEFKTGKHDICPNCSLKNYIKDPKLDLNKLQFFKWKIFEEIDNWNQIHSNKTKKNIFLGHYTVSSDQSVEKNKQFLTNSSIYNHSNHDILNSKLNGLKYSFQNFNFYSYFYKSYFNELNKFNLFNNYTFIFKKTNNKLFSRSFYKKNCMFDINIFKEAFFKLDIKLHEYILFTLTWFFFESFNVILITLDLFYNSFIDSVAFFQEESDHLVQNLMKLSFSYNSSYNWKKKIKKSLKKIHKSLFHFLSINYMFTEFNQIFSNDSEHKKYNFLWYSALEISFFQKLKWAETVMVYENIVLTKEVLIEKFKNLVKNYKFKNSINIKPFTTCNIQFSFQNKNEKSFLIYLTVVDPQDDFKFKQIKIKCDFKLIIPLLIFACVRFRISFFFFLFKGNRNEKLLLCIKNQFSKAINSTSFQMINQRYQNNQKNIFNLIKCIMIQDDNGLFDFSSRFRFSNNKQKLLIFTINQIITYGPSVYNWFSKKFEIINKLAEINYEFFFIHKFKDIMNFCVKQNKSFHLKPFDCFLNKKNSFIFDKFNCQMGSQKIVYIFRKNILDKSVVNETLKYIQNNLTCNKFIFTKNSNNLILKEIITFLSYLRNINFKIYKIFKKFFYHESKFKWHYQLAFNVIKIKTGSNFTDFSKKGALSKIFELDAPEKNYLLQVFEISSKGIKNRLFPKNLYTKLIKNIKSVRIKNLLGVFRSWRENFIKLCSNGSLKFLENFKKSGLKIINGVLNTGVNFFIEKNFVFNYQVRFEHLIFKKLIFLPAKIVSVYPKISQIKFSSLIDEKRFLFFDHNYYLEPFKFLENKINFSFCNTTYIKNFIIEKKVKDSFLQVLGKNSFVLSFIIDENDKNFFSFKLNVFFDKKYTRFIYQWKNKIFFGPKNFFEKLINPFLKFFYIVTEHSDFVSCGSNNLNLFVNKIQKEKKKLQKFFFTFVDDEFLTFNFICKNDTGIKVKGEFTMFSGLFLFNNRKFLNIEDIKKAIYKKMNIH